jgi:protein gp37
VFLVSSPVTPESWVVDIRNQCLNAEVPFFFKQWGGVNKKPAGRLLEERIWDQKPLVIPQTPYNTESMLD